MSDCNGFCPIIRIVNQSNNQLQPMMVTTAPLPSLNASILDLVLSNNNEILFIASSSIILSISTKTWIYNVLTGNSCK